MGDPDTIRLYVWVEDRQHRPVFSEKANLGRGAPALMVLEKPVRASDIMLRYADVLRAHSTYGGGNAHEHREQEVTEDDLDVFLLPIGARVALSSLSALKDDDSVLIRAGPHGLNSGKPAFRPSIMVSGESIQTDNIVNIDYKILGVHAVDTVNQLFRADFLIMGSWINPKLAGLDSDMIDWDMVWNPEYDIVNAMDLENMSEAWGHRKSTWLDHDMSGKIHYHQRYKGTLSEAMELECFPFDHQALHIKLSSKGQNVNRVVYSMKGEGLLLQSKLPDWDLSAVRSRNVLTDPCQSLHGSRYSEVHIDIHAIRKEQYYIWNIGIILLAITSLSFAVFSVPPEQLADRLGLNFTLALTAMAFKFVVNQSLPVVAFLTPLDRYLLFNFGFLYLAIAANTITGLVPEALMQPVDNFLLTALSGLFILGQAYAMKEIHAMRVEANDQFNSMAKEEYGDMGDVVQGTEIRAADMYVKTGNTPSTTPREMVDETATERPNSSRVPPLPLGSSGGGLGEPLLASE